MTDEELVTAWDRLRRWEDEIAASPPESTGDEFVECVTLLRQALTAFSRLKSKYEEVSTRKRKPKCAPLPF